MHDGGFCWWLPLQTPESQTAVFRASCSVQIEASVCECKQNWPEVDTESFLLWGDEVVTRFNVKLTFCCVKEEESLLFCLFIPRRWKRRVNTVFGIRTVLSICVPDDLKSTTVSLYPKGVQLLWLFSFPRGRGEFRKCFIRQLTRDGPNQLTDSACASSGRSLSHSVSGFMKYSALTATEQGKV